MKILKEGTIPMPPPLWPVGSAFRCHHCRCEFLIDDTSSFRRETERRPGGKSFAYFICPTCGIEVEATRPTQSHPAQNWGDALLTPHWWEMPF